MWDIRSISKELAPLETDAVLAKLLEDDRALQELAVGFSASVSGRGSGSVQRIDGERARQVLEDIESVLTDASAQDKFQEHVFQWMRENLEGVGRNPSKYHMDKLCRRMAVMVRDSLSELLKKKSEMDTNADPIDISDVDISYIDSDDDTDIAWELKRLGELKLRRIFKQLRTDPWFGKLTWQDGLSDVHRYYIWLDSGRPDLNQSTAAV